MKSLCLSLLSLKTLSLDGVAIVGQLSKVITSCLFLETLIIVHCWWGHTLKLVSSQLKIRCRMFNVEISAPGLKSLELLYSFEDQI